MSARHLAIGLGPAVLVLSACGPAGSAQLSTVEPAEQSRATIAAEPAGPEPINPGQRIVVTASDGLLADVTVLGPKGPLKGRVSPDGTTWTARKPYLDFGATYTVTATAVDPRGVATTHLDEFRTLEPKEFFGGSVLPGEDATVGVGMPITVTFDREIKNKDEVERALVVYTPTPLVGAWSWNGPTEVQFRPKEYWPGNIDVTVALRLKGVQATKGVFGQANESTTFHIGPSMVTKVNAQTHQAKVFRDEQLVRTIPVTSGKIGFETRSGVKVVVSKERTRVMDAATGGTEESDPEYYRIQVEYAMRVTYTGEFMHAAPWSVGSQGWANVSHGCIGMSTANAAWLYDLTNVGDVVEVKGTSNPQNLGNGITVWNEAWDEWLAKSKAGPVMTTSAEAPHLDGPATDSSAADPSATGAFGTSQVAYTR